jgi:hypothetical protein
VISLFNVLGALVLWGGYLSYKVDVYACHMSKNIIKLKVSTLEKRIFLELLETVRVNEDNCDINHLRAF